MLLFLDVVRWLSAKQTNDWISHVALFPPQSFFFAVVVVVVVAAAASAASESRRLAGATATFFRVVFLFLTVSGRLSFFNRVNKCMIIGILIVIISCGATLFQRDAADAASAGRESLPLLIFADFITSLSLSFFIKLKV